MDKLPKTGSCNYLYTLREDNLTIFYRYFPDQKIEKIELSRSLFGAVHIEAGDNVTLTGNGSEENPYIISSTEQNNKTIVFNTFPYNETGFGRLYYFEEAIDIATNNTETFIVKEDEIYILRNSYPVVTPGNFSFNVDYYQLKKGKGTYGKEGTTTLESDYFLIRRDTSSQISNNQASDPEVYTIQYGDVEAPELAVNTSNQQYVITSQADAYFVITTPPRVDPVESNIYRFVGGNGTYGQGGSTTQNSDYILVDSIGSDIPTENNYSRVINVTSVDLANAVEPTLEEQLITFVNALNYDKGSQDSGIWIDYKYTAVPDLNYTIEVYSESGYSSDQVKVFIPQVDNLTSVAFTVELPSGAQTGTTVLSNNVFLIPGALPGDTLIFTGVSLNLTVGGSVAVTAFNITAPLANAPREIQTLLTAPSSNGSFTNDEKYRIIDVGKGILNLTTSNLQKVCCDRFIPTNTSDIINDGENGTNPFITDLDLGDRGHITSIGTGATISYGLRDVNRSLNHITIGSNSMDLIKRDSLAQVGIGGQAGFGFGFDLFAAASHYGPTMFGYNNRILGGTLGTVFGQDNVINSGYATFVSGVNNIISSPLGYTFTTGRNNSEAGRYSATLGVGLVNRGYGTVVGVSNLDNKGTTSSGSANNPLFIVGNGAVSGDSSNTPTTRSDAFLVYQDGRLQASSLTPALINTPRSLITKEYLEANSGSVVQLTESSSTGFILTGDNRSFKGNIGSDAVDFSRANAGTSNGATGSNSAAFGFNTTAGAFGDFAEGLSTRAIGTTSHAEGNETEASGASSHAEGLQTTASGSFSHAEGDSTTASGARSHAEGHSNFARGNAEHSGGAYGTDYTATNTITDRLVNYGNGINSGSRSDAWTLYRNGAHKFFSAALTTVTNAVKGFIMLDENARPNVHNGTQWNALAYQNDVYSKSEIDNRAVTFTGTVIPLNNNIGSYQTITPNTATAYTLAVGSLLAGKAKVRINAISEPTLPATHETLNVNKITGSTFTASTDMYLFVEREDGRIIYWFEIV